MINKRGDHRLPPNSKVLVDSTNTRTGTPSSDPKLKRPSSKGGYGSRQSINMHHYTAPQSKSIAVLNDLNPEDKAKIARLVEQVMSLTNENRDLKQEVKTIQEERDLAQTLSVQLRVEKQSFVDKRSDSLRLLSRYQEKIQYFSDELIYTRKAYDDLSQRYNTLKDTLHELEQLVQSQKITIENAEGKFDASARVSKELQDLKDDLRHRSDDCERYKAKSESLESNSKYLAAQLDGLLFQLTEKSKYIHGLESKIKIFQTKLTADDDETGDVVKKYQQVSMPSDQPSNPNPLHQVESVSQPITAHLPDSTTFGATGAGPGTAEGHTLVPSDTATMSSPTSEQLLASWSEQSWENDGKQNVAKEAISDDMSGAINAPHSRHSVPTESIATLPSVQNSFTKETHEIHLATPPLPLTPPRNMSMSRDTTRYHHSADDVQFNDSTFNTTIVPPSDMPGDAGAELTDEYLLERINRHIGRIHSHPAGITHEIPLVTTKASVHVNQRENGVDSSSVTAHDPHKLKKTPTVNLSNNKASNSMKGKPNPKAQPRKVVSSNRRSTISAKTAAGDIAKKVINKYSSSREGSLSHSSFQPPRSNGDMSVAAQSPGLKAWEESSKTLDGGYGMQLFDLLDELNEGVHSRPCPHLVLQLRWGGTRQDEAQKEVNKAVPTVKSRRVSWSPDVVDNTKYGSMRYPVVIGSSELIKEKMVYTITVRLKDCTWNVYRRYSEFEAFHDALVEESVLGPEEYPSLPKKRWFELGRWTSRHDEEYTKLRRNDLQKYLQLLFKINKKVLVEKSKVLHSFLEFNQLTDIVKSRRELLKRNSSPDGRGDMSPPSDATFNDDHSSSNSSCHECSEQDEVNTQERKRSTSTSIFDIFSMSTGDVQEDEIVTDDVMNTSIAEDRCRNTPVLKSCLKASSNFGSSSADSMEDGEWTAATTGPAAKEESRQQERQTSMESYMENVDPIKELKDFVRILIL